MVGSRWAHDHEQFTVLALVPVRVTVTVTGMVTIGPEDEAIRNHIAFSIVRAEVSHPIG